MELKQELINNKPVKKILSVAKIISILGVIGCIYSITKDPHHFFFSYLTFFTFFLSISLGAIFFVIMQFLSRAGWGVAVRRIPEVLMLNVIPLTVLFLPLLLGLHDLYHWTHADEVAKDHLLQVKAPYLNVKWFIIRAVLYFGAWNVISKFYFKKSISQDTDGSKENTLGMQKWSALSILIYGVTLTFAAIDWIMSITPHWYSTMFGVYIFAGGVVGSLSLFSIIYILLVRNGYLKNIVTIEHFHDLGKLIYGFNIFWSYVAFSQFFLIWYANIPEETLWFTDHFKGSWEYVAALLCIGHFGIPFILFISRHMKRNLTYHFWMACWILFMHLVDVYWIVMPNISKYGIQLSVADVSCFLLIGGCCLYVFIKNLGKVSLFPTKDPRINESIAFQNY